MGVDMGVMVNVSVLFLFGKGLFCVCVKIYKFRVLPKCADVISAFGRCST